MSHCSVLGSCKNICYRNRLVVISTYCCMVACIYTACFMCLVHSRADVKWDRLRETNFNIVLLRGGKWAQALPQPSSGVEANQALRFFRRKPELLHGCNSLGAACWDGNNLTIHQEREYEGVSNTMARTSPLTLQAPGHVAGTIHPGGGAEWVHEAGCSHGDGSRLSQAGKGWQPWSVPPWVQT